MTESPSPRIPPTLIERSRTAAGGARAFCEQQHYPLGVTMIDHTWFGGPAEDVIDALRAYQNDDGGFGNGLEVDIAAPDSNPFAARLAMHVLLALEPRPTNAVETGLAGWLESSQAEDGDWHFSDATRAGALAPWFAGWTFPSLNPACCIAGLADRLGIATPTMLSRVANLFTARASETDLATGAFYDVLPYAEYIGSSSMPGRDRWVARVARAVTDTDARNGYSDPAHYFEHALGGGMVVLDHLSPERNVANASRMLDEQLEDGGWPSPYSDAWRPWQTAFTCVVLAALAR